MPHIVPFTERKFCTVTEAGLYLAKGRSTIWALIAEGRLEAIKDGGRRKVSVASVVRFGEAMESAVA